MDPGRELDAKVAELLGWRWFVHAPHTDSLHPGERFLISQPMDEYLAALVVEAKGDEPVYDYRHSELANDLPRYSTDIAQAFELVDWMRERGWDFSLLADADDPLKSASFERETPLAGAERGASTFSEAICRAFVAAMEAEQ